MDAQARIAELEAGNGALKGPVCELEEQLARVVGKVAQMEKLLGRNSSNPSKPSSADAGFEKSARPDNANRAARRAMGRK